MSDMLVAKEKVCNQAEVSKLLTSRLKGEKFAQDSAQLVFGALMTGQLSPVQVSALLVAMSLSGESEEELAAIAQAVLQESIAVTAPSDAVDIVGTAAMEALLSIFLQQVPSWLGLRVLALLNTVIGRCLLCLALLNYLAPLVFPII